jgi:hypothetical protein
LENSFTFMKKTSLLFLLLFISVQGISQRRNINRLTLEDTYSYTEIQTPLRERVNRAEKSEYFKDAFFNRELKDILLDKHYTDKEKVHLFYLMQQKLGFAYIGVSFLPPQQDYFHFFMGEVVTWQNTRTSLKELDYHPGSLLSLVDSSFKRDAILASNALLLATLLNPELSGKALEHYSRESVIRQAKNPEIFHHYVCLSAALKQNAVITANLKKNIFTHTAGGYIEDALCAFYARNNPVRLIKDYIIREQNPKNTLAIQTALCVLHSKVPRATFDKSLNEFISEIREDWKKELCRQILHKQIPYNYSLADQEHVVAKIAEGVTMSVYNDGTLINSDMLMDFDPN